MDFQKNEYIKIIWWQDLLQWDSWRCVRAVTDTSEYFILWYKPSKWHSIPARLKAHHLPLINKTNLFSHHLLRTSLIAVFQNNIWFSRVVFLLRFVFYFEKKKKIAQPVFEPTSRLLQVVITLPTQSFIFILLLLHARVTSSFEPICDERISASRLL